MKPAKWDIECKRGDLYALQIRFPFDAGTNWTDGVWTYGGEIRFDASKTGTPDGVFNYDDSTYQTDGKVLFTVDTTALVPGKKYRYDIERRPQVGGPRTFIEGTFTVTQDVTK